MRLILGLSAIALLLVGCSGNVYRTVKLDPDADGAGTSIVTDARQRLISNVKPGQASRPGQIDPLHVICVEPSPDVAVAVANSFGLGVGVSGYGSGSLSGAAAEGLAQIAERTTAIQAILRQGYQACIDYMNGAINGTTYSLRQSHLDDLLVTLVLAEDAAGAFGRKGAAISTNSAASAEAAASILPDISKGLDQATNDLSQKQQDVDKKKAALDKANADLEANKSDQPTIDAQAKAQREYDDAVAARNAAMRSVTGLTEAASKATAGATAVGQGGITAQPDPEIARAIADMQDTFVNKDVEQAYISTCLIELGQWKQRDPEDDRFRQDALRARENGETDDASGYFLATQLGQQTWLTDHCKANFDTFLLRAQENRYNLNVMKMQIEAQRVNLDRLKLENASLAVGGGSSPVFARAAAVAAEKKLTPLLADIAKQTIRDPKPGDSDALQETLRDLKQRQAAIAKKGAELATQSTTLPLEKDVTDIDAKLRALDVDLRQEGSAEERQSWKEDFALARAQAAFLVSKFQDYRRAAQFLIARASTLQEDMAGTALQ